MRLTTKRIRRMVSALAVLLALMFAVPVSAADPSDVAPAWAGRGEQRHYTIDRVDGSPDGSDSVEWTLQMSQGVEWT